MITPKIGIAIVAPGGYAQDTAALGRGIARLEQQGCIVHNYYDPQQVFQRFGGTDEASRSGVLLPLRSFHRLSDLYDRIPRHDVPSLPTERRIGLA